MTSAASRVNHIDPFVNLLTKVTLEPDDLTWEEMKKEVLLLLPWACISVGVGVRWAATTTAQQQQEEALKRAGPPLFCLG